MEDDRNHTPHRKSISVIAKVKEKAKKWRQTLSSKKKNHFDDEIGPQGYKQASTKHSRAVPVNIKNVQVSPTPSPSPNRNNDAKSNHNSKRHLEVYPGSPTVRTSQGPSPHKHLRENYPGSARAPVTSPKGARPMPKAMSSDATNVLASKLHSLTLSNNETYKPETHTPNSAPARVSLTRTGKSSLPTISTKHTSTEVGKSSPSSAPAAVEASSYMPSTSKQLWDKGVSVKEYILRKFAPGEDERVLSQVISKAISPRKPEDDVTVVEKVREAVTSLLQNQQSSSLPNRSVYHSAQNSESQFPHLTVNNEITEAETLERLLRTN